MPGIQVFDFDTALGLDVLPKLIDELSIELTMAPLWWGEVESSRGVYDWANVEWWEKLAPSLSALPQLIWTLYPVHMNDRGPLPADLRDEPFDSAKMLDRFEEFVGAAAARAGWNVPGTIVLVGNEIDTWWQKHPDEAEAFLTFSDHAARVIRSAAPASRVVNTYTHGALDLPGGEAFVRDMSRSMDLMAFQWYDNKPDGTVSGERTLEEEMRRWERVADGRPVVLPEIGLATANACGSSEELQAEHVDQVFDIIASRTRAQFEGVVWLGMHDWDRAQLRGWVGEHFPELVGQEAFFEMLVTLGLKRQDDAPKLGYQRWLDRARRHRDGRAEADG